MKTSRFLAIALAAALTSSIGAAGPSDIANAAQAKNADAVKKLLKEGADVNGAQGDGMTALPRQDARPTRGEWRVLFLPTPSL